MSRLALRLEGRGELACVTGAAGRGGDGESGDVRVPGEVVHVFVCGGGVGMGGWLHAGWGFFDFAEDYGRRRGTG